MFKIHREFKKLNIGKVNISIEKKKILNRFLKMGNKNGRKHLKKCSLFLAISEGKLKLSLDFILHLSKCRRSIAQVTANSDKNVDKGKYSSVSSRSANLHSTKEIRVAITWKDGNGSTSECRYITLGYTQRKFQT